VRRHSQAELIEGFETSSRPSRTVTRSLPTRRVDRLRLSLGEQVLEFMPGADRRAERLAVPPHLRLDGQDPLPHHLFELEEGQRNRFVTE
jgi:hypothetical protein